MAWRLRLSKLHRGQDGIRSSRPPCRAVRALWRKMPLPPAAGRRPGARWYRVRVGQPPPKPPPRPCSACCSRSATAASASPAWSMATTIWHRGTKIRIADIDTPEVGRPRCSARRRRWAGARRHGCANCSTRAPFRSNRSPMAAPRTVFGRRELKLHQHRDGRSLGRVLVREGLAARWGGLETALVLDPLRGSGAVSFGFRPVGDTRDTVQRPKNLRARRIARPSPAPQAGARQDSGAAGEGAERRRWRRAG